MVRQCSCSALHLWTVSFVSYWQYCLAKAMVVIDWLINPFKLHISIGILWLKLSYLVLQRASVIERNVAIVLATCCHFLKLWLDRGCSSILYWLNSWAPVSTQRASLDSGYAMESWLLWNNNDQSFWRRRDTSPGFSMNQLCALPWLCRYSYRSSVSTRVESDKLCSPSDIEKVASDSWYGICGKPVKLFRGTPAERYSKISQTWAALPHISCKASFKSKATASGSLQQKFKSIWLANRELHRLLSIVAALPCLTGSYRAWQMLVESYLASTFNQACNCSVT